MQALAADAKPQGLTNPVTGRMVVRWGDACLPLWARALVLDSKSVVVHASAVTVWEIAIEHALGHGDMPVSAAQAQALFLQAGYLLPPVTTEHTAATESLPPLHAGPVDRMRVAQALHEPLRFIKHRRTLAGYGSRVLKV